MRAAPLHLVSLALAAGLSIGAAAETLPGPVQARLIAVVDGDTLEVAAAIWLGQEVRIRVRLDGVDAPERRSRCPAEQAAAEAARAALVRLAVGPLRLVDVHYGKYAGRVLARVLDAAGRDIGAELVGRGLARRYDGGRRRPWCGS